MGFYQIPPTLNAEIDELESLIASYRRGDLDANTLRARRVPLGVYEQRKDQTYMIRIRCTGGLMTPQQLRNVALLSQHYGANSIHITTSG